MSGNAATLRLSVVVPVYNEVFTIREILRRVAAVPVPKEVILVDDGSTDGTREVLAELAAAGPAAPPPGEFRDGALRVVLHERNRGKGAALRTGFAHAAGDVVVVQDADLEYDPAELPRLMEPIAQDRADVVYGSRFIRGERRVLSYWHTAGNRFLTWVSNLFTDLDLTDMETCYKVFRREVIQPMPLRSNRFGFEPEITMKLAKSGVRIHELPISYAGRGYAEGKKIGWKDAVNALWTILRFWVTDDLPEATLKARSQRVLARAGRYHRWTLDQVLPWVGDRVLELGAGSGNLTRLLLDRPRVVALDPDPAQVTVLRERFEHFANVRVARWDPEPPAGAGAAVLPAEDGSFDTVLCANLLQYLADDEALLRRVKDCLEPGGRVIVLAPAHSLLYSRLDRLLNHRRRYRRAELRDKLVRAGFEPEALFHMNAPGALGWFLNGRLLGRRGFPRLQPRLMNVLTPLLALERLVRPPFGLSVVAVGRKG